MLIHRVFLPLLYFERWSQIPVQHPVESNLRPLRTPWLSPVFGDDKSYGSNLGSIPGTIVPSLNDLCRCLLDMGLLGVGGFRFISL